MIASVVLACFSALIASSTAATINCPHQYIPQGRKTNVGVLQFTGGGTESFVNHLDGLAGNPMKINPKQKTGTSFHFQSCNSTYFGAYPYQEKYCSDGHCYIDYYDSIRIINPPTGHCLTNQEVGNNTGFLNKLVFIDCDSSEKGGQQLFSTYQHTTYGPNYTGKPDYGVNYFVPYGFQTNYDPNYPQGGIFFTAPDNKTLLWPQENFGIAEDPNTINGFVVVSK